MAALKPTKIISSSGTQSYAGHAERSCLIGGHFQIGKPGDISILV
jgi:hypothetical protein